MLINDHRPHVHSQYYNPFMSIDNIWINFLTAFHMIEPILHKSMLQESLNIVGVILREVKGHPLLATPCAGERSPRVYLREFKGHALLRLSCA